MRDQNFLRVVSDQSEEYLNSESNVLDVQEEPPSSLRIKAPAKINIYFQVADRRDDEYHDVSSLYCAVSLYDYIHVTTRMDEKFTVKVRQNSPQDSESALEIPLDGNNLAVKAARLLAENSKFWTGVDIEIEKNIPVAAGLAGGSADAAAVLVGCNALWGKHLTREQLEKLGTQLGADVPFSIMGSLAIGEGTGADLSPVLIGEALWWVIAPADYGLSTPAVFARLDEDRINDPSLSIKSQELMVDKHLLQAMRAGDAEIVAKYVRNDLTAAAIELTRGEPQGQSDIEKTIMLGKQSGALVGFVSGSGPSVIFLVSDKNDQGIVHHGEDNARILASKLNALRGSEKPECIVVKGPIEGVVLI